MLERLCMFHALEGFKIKYNILEHFALETEIHGNSATMFMPWVPNQNCLVMVLACRYIFLIVVEVANPPLIV